MKKLILKCLGVILFIFLSQSSWALSCFAGTGLSAWAGKSRIQTEKINRPILVPFGMTTPGTTLWRSQSYTTTFTCFDTDIHPAGENAYLYWDPQIQLSTIHPSIQVGVTINGVDQLLVHGGKILLAAGTVPPSNNKNCTDIGVTNSRSCATPVSLTVSYNIFIKATGANPPADGRVPNAGTYSVFQVDGVGGLNAAPNSNFNLYVAGLDNIKFVQCRPEVSVRGTVGNIVHFGKITTKPNNVNKIIAKERFAIIANLQKADTGGVCNGQTLVSTFIAVKSQNFNTILPSDRSDIGIQIFNLGGSRSLTLNTPYDLSTVNNGIASNVFEAGLLQLTPNPKVGHFSAITIVEVTFK